MTHWQRMNLRQNYFSGSQCEQGSRRIQLSYWALPEFQFLEYYSPPYYSYRSTKSTAGLTKWSSFMAHSYQQNVYRRCHL